MCVCVRVSIYIHIHIYLSQSKYMHTYIHIFASMCGRFTPSFFTWYLCGSHTSSNGACSPTPLLSMYARYRQRRYFIHDHSRREANTTEGNSDGTVAHLGNQNVVFTFTRGIYRYLCNIYRMLPSMCRPSILSSCTWSLCGSRTSFGGVF